MGRGSARTKSKPPAPATPGDLKQAVGESPHGRTFTSTEKAPLGPSKSAPESKRLEYEDAMERPEPGSKRPRSISPQDSPKSPPTIHLPQTQKHNSHAYREVTFDDQKAPQLESQEDPMSEKDPMCEPDDKKAKPESEKDPMSEPNDKKARLDFDGDSVIQDADFALLYCDENAEICGEPEVKTEAGDSRLFDSAKKFANEDKTPLKSSNSFNVATLIRSASHSLAGILNTPATSKRAPGGKKRASSPKGMCSRMSQSQDNVFGEDSSSDSDEEDK